MREEGEAYRPAMPHRYPTANSSMRSSKEISGTKYLRAYTGQRTLVTSDIGSPVATQATDAIPLVPRPEFPG
jgi:hypothetical protein